MITSIALILFAYLLGSISTAIITCHLMSLPDPRTLGSQNPGATNVLRIGGKQGKKAAAITLFGDGLKGFIPVFVALLLNMESSTIALVGICAFLGHLFPVFFSFKGGKGVATAFGVLLAINYWIALVLLLIWLVVAFGLKISSLSALIATMFAPILFWFWADDVNLFYMSIFISVLLLYRHKSNIQNLLSGKETKIKS